MTWDEETAMLDPTGTKDSTDQGKKQGGKVVFSSSKKNA
jgi:hypothetical protein